jgi:hypothetical protein
VKRRALKTLGIALLFSVLGYVLGVFAGIGLVNVYSSAKPDKAMEAVMTGFFYVGPLGAVLGFLGALIYRARRRPTLGP